MFNVNAVVDGEKAARVEFERERTYTARVTANGKVTTSMDTVRVLHVILETSDVVLVEDRHGLVGGALLCEPALDIALEAARVVVEIVARAHVDLEPVAHRVSLSLHAKSDGSVSGKRAVTYSSKGPVWAHPPPFEFPPRLPSSPLKMGELTGSLA